MAKATILSWTEEDQMRLLGHRDGVITALLLVRQHINAIEYRYKHTSPHHTKLLDRKKALLTPLRALEESLEKERASNQDTYNERQKWKLKS